MGDISSLTLSWAASIAVPLLAPSHARLGSCDGDPDDARVASLKGVAAFSRQHSAESVPHSAHGSAKAVTELPASIRPASDGRERPPPPTEMCLHLNQFAGRRYGQASYLPAEG